MKKAEQAATLQNFINILNHGARYERKQFHAWNDIKKYREQEAPNNTDDIRRAAETAAGYFEGYLILDLYILPMLEALNSGNKEKCDHAARLLMNRFARDMKDGPADE